MALSFRAFVGMVPHLNGTKRWEKLTKWERYYEGEQYADREFDEEGQIDGLPGYFGGGPDGYCPWYNRKIRAVHNVAKDIVDELAEWTLIGSAWPGFSIPEDPDAQEWLEGLIQMSNLAHVAGECVKIAGGCATGIMSASWKDGAARFEAHRPKLCWVLRWADAKEKVPAEIVKVYAPADDFESIDETEKKEEYRIRYWSSADGKSVAPGIVNAGSGVEALYRVYRNDDGDWVVSLLEAVVHGCKRCPVFWVPNSAPSEEDGNDGKPDFFGQEGKIDDMNELFQASSNTSKRNADDTVVVKTDPKNAPGFIRKGPRTAIIAEGGADYLSQDGASAKIMNEHGVMRENQIYRACGTVKADTQDLAKQTSGEALRRLYFKQIQKCDGKRQVFSRYMLRPICRWLLEESRKMNRTLLDMPLVIIENDDGTIKETRERKPGKSINVVFVWPDPFPPTIDDLDKASNAVKNTTAGARVLSTETAIKALVRAGAPVASIKAEVQRVKQDAEEKAAQDAKAIGMSTAEKTKAENEHAGDIEAGE